MADTVSSGSSHTSHTSHTSNFSSATWSLAALTLVVALWLTLVGNLALWRQLYALPEVSGWHGMRFLGLMATGLCAVLVAILGLSAWPRVFKPVATLMLLIAAGATHFMLTYSTLIDSSMVMNIWHTDTREATDLFSLRFVWTLLGVGIIPAGWLCSRPVRSSRILARLGTVVGLVLGGGLVAALALFLMFQDFASVMRNHKSVRYLINPLNSVYAVAKASADAGPTQPQPLQTVGEDAAVAFVPSKRPALLVLVVGETARAANFGLGGYARNTTPKLAARAQQGELAYFSQVHSCGTSTQASLPCMFSPLGKTQFEKTSQRYENLLDVLSRAGLAVLWIDNQSGCKGVCERVASLNTCDGGDCLDEIMIAALQRQWAALPLERRQRGTVVVLHQMGSHGPAYFKRSSAQHQVFQPACASAALESCTSEEVVNAYDNSLHYTDHFLDQTIEWLGQQSQVASTALLYVSDHGESLGENNLYLHGLPYAIAPQEQKHVPMLVWLSAAMQQRKGLTAKCLNASHSNRPLTHDHLFHSVLGLMDVQTRARQPALDIFHALPCAPVAAASTAPTEL